MFMGEYNHTIDAKGRLIVPSKFREQLGDEFVVTKGLDGCLFVYDNTEWKKFEEKLQALPLTNQNARKKREKEVVLVGVGSRIEIWNKATWAEKNVYDDMEEIAENMEGLGI